MAETIIPQTEVSQNEPMTFTFGLNNLYQLVPGTTKLTITDQLQARLDQLGSMLMMIHGNGFDNFDLWADHVKDNYLWACSTLAEECKELARHL